MASFLISIKYNEDIYYSNEFYSKVGGIPLTELDRLEYEFLILTNFNIYVSPELYSKYYESFMNSYTNEEEALAYDEQELSESKKEKLKKKKSSKKEKKSSETNKTTSKRKESTESQGTTKKHTRSKS